MALITVFNSTIRDDQFWAMLLLVSPIVLLTIVAFIVTGRERMLYMIVTGMLILSFIAYPAVRWLNG